MRNKEKKYHKLKPNQFLILDRIMAVLGIVLLGLIVISYLFKIEILNKVIVIVAVGVAITITMTIANIRTRKYSRLIYDFIRSRELCQYYITEKGEEKIKYYPDVRYKKIGNYLYFRWRLDGSNIAQRIKGIEQELADKLFSVCTNIERERGYITFELENEPPKQMVIETIEDIPVMKEHEIQISHLSWDWEKTPHLLLTGKTQSGKTEFAKYLMLCLQAQGVKVFYCDPKQSVKARKFCEKFSIPYAGTESEITKTVQRIENEMRSRGQLLEEIKYVTSEFPPIFLFVDELIAFSKISTKENYKEVSDKLASLVVMGAEKKTYVCLMAQRPDVKFIEGAVRENLNCKVCMSEMSETAYAMIFGPDFVDIHNIGEGIGSGLILRHGVDNVPRQFFAPFIKPGALE